MKKGLILCLYVIIVSIMLMGCRIEKHDNIIAGTEETDLENTENMMEDESTQDTVKEDISWLCDELVGLRKIKECHIEKADEKDIHLTDIATNEKMIVKAPVDMHEVLLYQQKEMLCYDGGKKVTLEEAMETNSEKMYDFECMGGLCLLNSHEEVVPLNTLLNESKWYVYMCELEGITATYSLNIDDSLSEFDNILNQFGKPDEYILCGKHLANFNNDVESNDVVFAYTMLVYHYDNYDLLIKVSEQYNVTDDKCELISASVWDSYAMSHEAMDDYMDEYVESWGDCGVFESLDIRG